MSEQQYLIWSHHHKTWWAANGRGYRRDVLDAGRYTLAETVQWLGRGCGCCQVPEVVIPVPPVDVLTAPGRTAVWVGKQVKAATDVRIAAGQVNRWAEVAS